MTILWCGGEDIDFDLSAYSVTTDTSHFDSTFSRCALQSGYNGNGKSNIFQAISSGWLSFQFNNHDSGSNRLICGLRNSVSGAWIGLGKGSAYNKASLYKYDGSSATYLDEEAGVSLGYNSLKKIDINLINYSNIGQVKIYIDEALVIDYSGDVAVLSETEFDQIAFFGSVTGGDYYYFSQFIVADETTIGMHLLTNHITAAGDSNTFDYGSYTDVDEALLSDADQIYATSADELFLANLNNLPSGDFAVKAVKIAARCSDGTGSLGVKLGVKSNGTISVENTAQNCSGYWQTKERMMATNPVTGNPFTMSEIDSVQLAAKSGTV